MQNRYKISNIFTSKTQAGKTSIETRRLESYIIPQIQFSEDDIYIYSKVGDRLDNLAFKYYDDQSLWWVIAKANNIGKGTWILEPGQLIRIPKISNGFDLLEELQVYQRDYR